MAQQYTKDGELLLPKDYRQWIFLSSGIGMTYSGTASKDPAFENVFVNPEAYRGFLKTGTWPDKTVMVLEVRKSESRVSINKDGRVQTSVAATEVHDVFHIDRGYPLFVENMISLGAEIERVV